MRTESEHLQSGNKIITDAPIDNEGKGEGFSPTDLVATSLANCMLTIMGIVARRHKVNIDGTRADVEKIMGTEPRRITEIQIEFYFPGNYDSKTKTILEKAALNCPVAKSLAESLQQSIGFNFSDQV
ncbi:uncharacterized protein METZ01_LOCUS53835 [marine metagenome]|uniref:OsmC family protein n=1 Tax=marine metagenome TaxID=408172 RepID=A0A381SCE5_9ZZZZ